MPKSMSFKEIVRILFCEGFGVFIVVKGWYLFIGLEAFSL